MGIAGYLRDYIPCYSKITACLERIRKIRGSLHSVWTEQHSAAVANLKEVLSNPPFLSQPKWDEKFTVGTDACNDGVGAVLYQDYDGHRHYISLMSKALTPAQRNYPATKKELLAIVKALSYFRQWIWGQHFELVTDHMSLIYYLSRIYSKPGIANKPQSILAISNPDFKPYLAVKRFIKECTGKHAPEDPLPLVQQYHALNHQGVGKLFQHLLNSGFYYPEMRRDL